MPINIYEETSLKQLAYLAENNWELPFLLCEFEKWIMMHSSDLPKLKIIADFGFSVRSEASGGGGIINAEILGKAAEANIDFYFSEYSIEED